MDQQHRLSLVKRYEDGIIDHHSTEYEKCVTEPMMELFNVNRRKKFFFSLQWQTYIMHYFGGI